MKKIWWIIGGAILTAAVFLISGTKGYNWTAVVGSLAVSGFYFIGLIIYIIRESQSKFDRMAGVGILVIITVITVYSGIFQYNRAQWQVDLLMDIRKTIDQNISTAYIQVPFLKSLNEYHLRAPESEVTLEDIFKKEYGKNIQNVDDRLRFFPEGRRDNSSPLLFFKQTASEDSVILIAQSLRVNGMDSTFTNYNGQKGRMQFKAILTKEGVDYAREN